MNITRHVVSEGCTFCPHCDFPAITEMLRKSLEIEAKCPMCNEDLDPSQVEEVSYCSVKRSSRIYKF